MAVPRFVWFVALAVVRAQKQPHNVDHHPSSSVSSPETTLAKMASTTTEILSYDPSEVCFNPQYDPYFKNDLLATSPVPKPNIYYGAKRTPDPESADPSSAATNREPRFANAWPADRLPKNFVPLVYIPSIPDGSGHVDRRTLRYLKDLKNALNANPLLATKNKTVGRPPNRFHIKFGSFPPADARSEAMPTPVTTTTDDGSASERETEAAAAAHRPADDENARRMASYLLEYGRRRKKRARNDDPSNAYPSHRVGGEADRRMAEPACAGSGHLLLAAVND